MKTNKTFLPKINSIQRKSYLIDASDKILGRIATKAATILRGKHKPIFTPHLDMGDQVIIINADKVKVSGKKLKEKIYLRFSGYPSGLKRIPLEEMLKRSPERVLRLAVQRMIPKGRLGNKIRRRLRVYSGNQHPFSKQKLIPLEI